MDLTRKEFIVLLIGSAAAACGGSSSDTPSGNCAANGTSVQIAQNTGHILNVSKADIAAGVQKTYTMQGDPSHTHDVTLTAADFANLAKNLQAMETSTVGNGGNGSHTHQITVSCA
ncbi:MAG: hypothetical protein ABR567_10420 [Myxococcales bacterium]|nr:hypothetical protein [Myxococcales bacterium]